MWNDFKNERFEMKIRISYKEFKKKCQDFVKKDHDSFLVLFQPQCKAV